MDITCGECYALQIKEQYHIIPCGNVLIRTIFS